MSELTIKALKGLPEIDKGDDLVSLIVHRVRDERIEIRDRDIFVVAQKVVSKAEGRTVRLDSVTPSPKARDWAEAYDKDPRLVEVVLSQSRRIVRMENGVIISETEHGWICANAGVDASNTPDETAVLLPVDPDSSARQIRAGLESAFGVSLAVIISDTFGRPWREGLVNVAIGIAGMPGIVDYRGELDSHGRPLRVTTIAVADELASAAELVMKKTDRVPVAIISGFDYEPRAGGARELIREPERDLFR
ncbi:MAG TPA: coenzyme F420-0:L-glutamate ligase [Blastocatellia bacterium]|nr:coenzyme F420-0:L-glutamate ligase [Blastocatellia bacterium]